MAEGPKVAVLGAGAVGRWIGGAWAAAGLPVTIVGREATVEELDAHGLTLTEAGARPIHLPAASLTISADPAALAGAEIVALAVKARDTEDAARAVARNAPRGATVVSFQNGVGNAAVLEKRLPDYGVKSAMVPFNVALMGRGRVHKGVSGDMVVEGAPATERLSRAVGDRPGRLYLARDIRPILWGKLLLNLNNAVNALSGRSLLDELSERDYRRVLAAAMLETLAVLKKAGIRPHKIGPIAPELLPHAIAAPDFVFRHLLLRVMKIDADARSSMADDLRAGKRTEIDALNGAVVMLARAHGVRAPVNEAIVALIRQAEAGVEHVWEPARLRAHVLEGHQGVRKFGY